MEAWQIVRTRPLGKTYGLAFPNFINNLGYHFDLLAVYADGTVDCWGLLDLPLFRRKAATGWIAPQPPAGEDFSVHNLGGGTVAEAEWLVTAQELVELAEAAVARLNPQGRDLVDLEGEESTPHPANSKARIAKLGLTDERFYRLDQSGGEVLGKGVPLLVREGGEYALSPGAFYADGSARLRAGGPALGLEEVIAGLAGGDLLTAAPDGAWIRIDGLGRFRVGGSHWYVEPAERVREIRDEIGQLNGGPGARRACIQQHLAYQQDPSPANRERLREAYEAVPEHLRMYCGDMDSKDWPIRRIIYGDEARPRRRRR